jgi:hypothetical protein
MPDPFKIVQCQLWDKETIDLAGTPVEIAITHCEAQDAAVALFEKHYIQISSCGGAIIIGDSSPIKMITASEIAYCATLGLEIPRNEPYWKEVVVFRSVTFEQLLTYIALVGYGEDSNFDSDHVRASAFQILAKANKIGPMCFEVINRFVVGVRFLVGIPSNALFGIIEDALGFNERYFTMDLGREVWRKQFRSFNRFSLGPG